jgi:hypothetical protein
MKANSNHFSPRIETVPNTDTCQLDPTVISQHETCDCFRIIHVKGDNKHNIQVNQVKQKYESVNGQKQ